MMLAASMHRQLSPIEQARAFKRCLDQGMTVAAISAATGHRTQHVRNRLLLLDLPVEAQDMVEEKALSVTQATSMGRQMRRSRSATGTTVSAKTAWFGRSHPLAA